MSDMVMQKYRYMVLECLSEKLEFLLNDLEELARGSYDIVSIFNRGPYNGNLRKQVISTVIRVHLVGEEVPFDEEEIKRKLGF